MWILKLFWIELFIEVYKIQSENCISPKGRSWGIVIKWRHQCYQHPERETEQDPPGAPHCPPGHCPWASPSALLPSGLVMLLLGPQRILEKCSQRCVPSLMLFPLTCTPKGPLLPPRVVVPGVLFIVGPAVDRRWVQVLSRLALLWRSL